MDKASHFTVSSHWQLLLQDMQLNPAHILQMARLPADLFAQTSAYLLPDEYFRLWRVLEAAVDKQPLPLLFAQALSAECFDVPIFAALCSPNFNIALKRISDYKPLIGPVRLLRHITPSLTGLTLTFQECPKAVPEVLQLTELTFFTQLIRMATRRHVTPLSLSLLHFPKDHVARYEEFFGCRLTQGEHLGIRFSADDARRPFLTSNEGMWDFFEDSLNRKLAMVQNNISTQARVRTALLKALPSGETRLEGIASKLSMSKRTLQRKLAAEGILFQELLDDIRQELADHYLQKSQLPLGEIAFLLGYREPNSFTRAYNAWRGMSPIKFREYATAAIH